MDVPRVSTSMQGAGSILRFGMDRFALGNSIHRRWTVVSPFAHDRASLHDVDFSD
jgi:hypothetical protein